VQGEHLSVELKNLLVQIFSFDGSLRPTIEEIKDHPWLMDKSFNYTQIHLDLLQAGNESDSHHQSSDSEFYDTDI